MHRMPAAFDRPAVVTALIAHCLITLWRGLCGA